MKTLYVGFSFKHHNSGSGYHAVADGACYLNGDRLLFSDFPFGSFRKKINMLMIDILALVFGLKYEVIHYIYPENTVFISPFFLRKFNKKIVYTVHLGKDFWNKNRSGLTSVKIRALHLADLIFVLSESHIAEIENLVGGGKVRFVNHGITHDMNFSPDKALIERRRKEKKIIVVGRNYRDFDFLKEVINGCRDESVKFYLIGTGLDVSFFKSNNVVVCDRLSSLEYNCILRSAMAMFLPLTFATANNAILEAYAAALPVIVSDVPGVRSYPNYGVYYVKEKGDFFSAFNDLLDMAPEDYMSLIKNEYDASIKSYEWSSIRSKLLEIQMGVLGK